jgi:hypothetical protein
MPKKIEEITILPFYRFLLGTPIVCFFSFFTFPDCLRSYCSLSEPLRRFCPIPGPYPLHTRSFCLAAGCGPGTWPGVWAHREGETLCHPLDNAGDGKPTSRVCE